MVLVIFTICCLTFIAIVWPRVFFGTLGVLFVALILRIGFVLTETPDDKRETARQAAPEATYATLQKSQREAEQKRKADDWARETQPAVVVRRRTVIDTVGLDRRDGMVYRPERSVYEAREGNVW
jgi:hypothetical protein